MVDWAVVWAEPEVPLAPAEAREVLAERPLARAVRRAAGPVAISERVEARDDPAKAARVTVRCRSWSLPRATMMFP